MAELLEYTTVFDGIFEQDSLQYDGALLRNKASFHKNTRHLCQFERISCHR
jgi:hypothetical protein